MCEDLFVRPLQSTMHVKSLLPPTATMITRPIYSTTRWGSYRKQLLPMLIQPPHLPKPLRKLSFPCICFVDWDSIMLRWPDVPTTPFVFLIRENPFYNEVFPPFLSLLQYGPQDVKSCKDTRSDRTCNCRTTVPVKCRSRSGAWPSGGVDQ